jgi:hypothetical protein
VAFPAWARPGEGDSLRKTWGLLMFALLEARWLQVVLAVVLTVAVGL